MRAFRFPVTTLMVLAVAVVLVRIFPSAMASSGHVYYVATNGSDSNPGTIDQPWATLTNALGDLQPGDTLYVRGGTYQERVLPGPLAKGTESAPIIVQAYPGEFPVVKGLFWVNEPTYWIFDGINVTWDPVKNQLGEHMVKL